MDVKYLTYIVEMANQRSITKAANALFVSQPSLSQYLSKLESELGTPLFIRTKNELLPTPAGELYIEAARNVIDIQKQLYHNISTLSQTGQIRVGISSQWSLDVLTDILPEFQSRYPMITVKISQNKYDCLVHQLTAGKIDMALMVAVNPDDFPHSCELLRKEEIFFAIAKKHPLAADLIPGQPLTIEEIISRFQSTSFILCDEGSTLRYLTDQLFRQHHFIPLSCCDVNSNHTMQNMVSKQIGVSFIPDSYVNKTTDIDYYRVNPELIRYILIGYRKNTVFSEIDEYFLQLIREHPLFLKHKTADY